MSKLYISEYENAAAEFGIKAQAPQEPSQVSQVVDFSGGVASSNTFSGATRLIRVHTDAVCSVKFGQAPTATTSDARMAAGSTEYFGIAKGQKISVIANT